MKNQDKKRNVADLTGRYITIVMVALFIAGACMEYSKNSDKYVITDKANSKVTYRPLDGGMARDMYFEEKHAGMEMYDHISVGDTITGYQLSNASFRRAYYTKNNGLFTDTEQPRITTINGQNAAALVRQQQINERRHREK